MPTGRLMIVLIVVVSAMAACSPRHEVVVSSDDAVAKALWIQTSRTAGHDHDEVRERFDSTVIKHVTERLQWNVLPDDAINVDVSLAQIDAQLSEHRSAGIEKGCRINGQRIWAVPQYLCR